MNLYLNCQDNPVTYNKKNYLLRAAERLGLEWIHDYKGTANPEYVLNIEPYGQFIKGGDWTGIWEIDLLINRPERNATDWAAANTVFLATNFIPEGLKSFQDRCMVLYHGADPVLHRRIPTIEPMFDFVLCGAMNGDLYKERVRIMDMLSTKFGCKNYATGYRPWDYIQNLNTGRIQVIRSMGDSYETGEIAQRFFEGMMIGPVLAHYLPADMPNLGYVEGIDYMTYKSDEELVEKMELLLSHPVEREIMANFGRQKTLLNHTYEHRLMSIINVIQNYQLEKEQQHEKT